MGEYNSGTNTERLLLSRMPLRGAQDPATPELPGMDLSLSPPLEGEDPEWDKIKTDLRSQSFVGSGKFDDVVRRAWGAYQRGKAFKDRGDILPFNLRGSW